VENRFLFRKEIEMKALESLRLLLPKDEKTEILDDILIKELNLLEEYTNSEIDHVKFTLEKLCDLNPIPLDSQVEVAKEPIEMEAEKTIPYKLFRGPVDLGNNDLTYEEELEYKKITEEYKEFEQTLTSAFFWINNKRTVTEIAALIENEYDKTSIPFLMKVFQYYEKYNLLKLKQK